MTNNPHHKNLLVLLEGKSFEKYQSKFSDLQKYLGSKDPSFGLPIPVIRQLVKDYFKNNKLRDADDLTSLLDSLSNGDYYEEKLLIGEILSLHKELRKQVSTDNLDYWLNNLKGWAQVDSLCQSVFTVEEILQSWQEWELFLDKLNKSPNINKRRASLVFLTGPLRKSRDQRLVKKALHNIESLSSEKSILITKAISWLLRSGVTNFRNDIEVYVNLNKENLPAIAVRETTRKLATGKK